MHEYRDQIGIDKARAVPGLVRLELDASNSGPKFCLAKQAILGFASSTLVLAPPTLTNPSRALQALTYIILSGLTLIGGLNARGAIHPSPITGDRVTMCANERADPGWYGRWNCWVS